MNNSLINLSAPTTPFDGFETRHFGYRATISTSQIIVTSLQGLAVFANAILFATLVTYEIRHNEKRCLQTLARKTILLIGRDDYVDSGKLLRCVCIIGALLCLFSSVNSLTFYTLGYETDEGCTVVQILTVSLYIGSDSVVYMFLWIRQSVTCRRYLLRSRILYTFLSVLKWIVLSVVIALAVAMNCFLVLYERQYYNEATDSCERHSGKTHNMITYLWTAGSVALHVLLFLLFALPLMLKFSRKRPTHQNQNIRIRKESIARQFDTNKMQISAIVQRCVLIAISCVVTDVTTMLIAEFVLDNPDYKQVRALLYNINITYNLVIVITSFKEWKIMMSFGVAKKKEKMPITSHDTGVV